MALAPAILRLQPLSVDAFAPYGRALGTTGPAACGASDDAVYTSKSSDFWREHLFEPGAGGATEVLWVTYRSSVHEVTRLEKHLLTEQMLLPLNGDVVHVVAHDGPDGLPDLSSMAAFRIRTGQGVCMMPHCWHASRVSGPTEVQCAMLTRSSTTLDLVRGLRGRDALRESRFADIVEHRWQA